MSEKWNPRFLKYCESIGKKPEEVNRDTMPGWTVDQWRLQTPAQRGEG